MWRGVHAAHTERNDRRRDHHRYKARKDIASPLCQCEPELPLYCFPGLNMLSLLCHHRAKWALAVAVRSACSRVSAISPPARGPGWCAPRLQDRGPSGRRPGPEGPRTGGGAPRRTRPPAWPRLYGTGPQPRPGRQRPCTARRPRRGSAAAGRSPRRIGRRPHRPEPAECGPGSPPPRAWFYDPSPGCRPAVGRRRPAAPPLCHAPPLAGAPRRGGRPRWQCRCSHPPGTRRSKSWHAAARLPPPGSAACPPACRRGWSRRAGPGGAFPR
mmetsp:Transcript_11189/g.28181  ORF Transcript_11189/g.28181 Transcript_11189/m.28181 type:complete len:270 (-) Transcript_11189:321-1130(-)